MNETTSAAGDFGGLELTDKEEASGAVMVELDVPDDTDPSELEDAITRALNASAGVSAVVFESADEFLSVENLEMDGVWAECPFLPGHAVLVRRGDAARSKYAKIEREYRIKNKQTDGETLTNTVQEGILRESMFETVLRGWRGFAPTGGEWPFDLVHYRKLWAKKRWREWLISAVAKLGSDDSQALEQVRKNS